MQKKTSTIKFEPSNLFYLTRQTPIETLRLDSNPLPYDAEKKTLRLNSNPPTLASIEALLGWIQTLSTLLCRKKTLRLNSNPPTYFQTL
jgi:hypothetical protein